MPAKEDGVSAQTDDSIFLLLVRGSSDRTSIPEGSQDLDFTSEPEEDTLLVDQTPPSDPQTLVSDCEVEDTNAHGRSLLSLFRIVDLPCAFSDVAPLGSPMCPITIPIHYRGYSSFVGQCYVFRFLL